MPHLLSDASAALELKRKASKQIKYVVWNTSWLLILLRNCSSIYYFLWLSKDEWIFILRFQVLQEKCQQLNEWENTRLWGAARPATARYNDKTLFLTTLYFLQDIVNCTYLWHFWLWQELKESKCVSIFHKFRVKHSIWNFHFKYKSNFLAPTGAQGVTFSVRWVKFV